MQLSDWIEQTESDFSFRSWNIPPGIEVKYWNEENLEKSHNDIIEKYTTITKEIFENFYKQGIIPVKEIEKLIWMSWDTLRTMENVNRKDVDIAEFLVTVFKILIIDGPTQAAEYYQKKVKQNNLIKTWINCNANVMDIVENLATTTCEHAKLDILHKTIETFFLMDSKFRGIIFTKDENMAINVHQYLLKSLESRVHLVRMIEKEGQIEKGTQSIQKISSVFSDGRLPKIAIIPIKIGMLISNIDTLNATSLTFVISMDRECIFTLKKYQGAYLSILHDKYEKLRKDDGRIVVEDFKFANRDQKNVKIGAVERYEFKFETSRLRLNAAKLPLAYFYPKRDCLTNGLEKAGRNTIEISSKDHIELVKRIKNTNFTAFRKRKYPFMVIDSNVKEVSALNEKDIIWNCDSQYLGDVRSSNLSTRLAEYLGSQPIERRARSRRFQYKNDISDMTHIKMLDSLIRRIDLMATS